MMPLLGNAEFGLVVMGHEFDSYQKKMIQDARSWEWYIEEHKEESEDDHGVEGPKEKKHRRKKRKKGEEDDDEEWTGESEEERDLLLSKPRKVQKPLYSTRSRDPNRTVKDRRNANKSGQKEPDEDDEDDETLGGFIVDDVLDDECEMDEDEEEDFIEDEDEE